MKLAIEEPRLCQPGTPPLRPVGSGIRVPFETSEPCNYTNVQVIAGNRYEVVFKVTEGWSDGNKRGDSRGLTASQLGGPGGYLGVPFRRVLQARWLQPLYEIRPTGTSRQKLPSVHIDRLNLARVRGKNLPAEPLYWGEFVAPVDGELFLFSNEAGHAADICYFYASKEFGNRGAAQVIIRDLGPAQTVGMAPPPSGTVEDWEAIALDPVTRPPNSISCQGWSESH